MTKEKKSLIRMDKRFVAFCWIFTIIVSSIAIYEVIATPPPVFYSGSFELPIKQEPALCNQQESGINDLIEQGNFCETDSDCIAISLGCPFGCESYVNKGFDLNPLRELVDLFNAECDFCEYECPMPKEPVCESGKCVEPV